MSDKNRWVSFSATPSDYNALMALSTKRGSHPKDMAYAIFLRGLEEIAKESIEDVRIATWLEYNKDKRASELKAQLVAIAQNALQQGNEDRLQVVEALCEQGGITFESVIELARVADANDVYLMDHGNGVAKACTWLLEFLGDGEQWSRSVIESGKDAGFSELVLREAKAKLNIPSIRRGRRWVWSAKPIRLEFTGQETAEKKVPVVASLDDVID